MQPTKNELTTTELLVLSSEMNKREKSLVLAYLMLLGGHFGAHRFYMKRTASAIIQLILFILAMMCYIGFAIATSLESILASLFLSMALLIATLVLGLALTIWVIVDACLLPGMVRAWNSELEQTMIGQLVAGRAQFAGGLDHRQ